MDDPTLKPRTGRRVLSEPSQSARAHTLDPDIPAWEKQPNETPEAYDAFVKYRDSQERKVGECGYWSCVWSWGYRTHEWDKFLAAVDVKEMVRYRRTMNERQRTAARVAQNKVAEWLVNLDVKTLRPADVARFWEIAVRIERTASGADPMVQSLLDRDEPTDDLIGGPDTFRDLIGDLDLDESEMARALHSVLTQRVTGP